VAERHEQAVDAAEVVVEAAEAHPAGLADRVDGHLLLALLHEHPQRGLKKQISGHLAALLLRAHDPPSLSVLAGRVLRRGFRAG
jgi:hypothetical protein